MKFAEFYPGQVIEAGPVEVTEADILAYARAWDPQWFHTDPAAAKGGPFKGLIASGWHTVAVSMRLVVEAVLADSESYASPGLDSLRWPHPVRPGDRLRVAVTIVETRRSAKDATLGIVRWHWKVSNQDDAVVLDLVATNLFKPVP